MRTKMVNRVIVATLTVSVVAGAICAGNAVPNATSPEALQAEIEALKPAKIAWRDIAWKSCLLEGLKESREKKKPVLLWIFIDRPVDDARC